MATPKSSRGKSNTSASPRGNAPASPKAGGKSGAKASKGKSRKGR